MGCDVAYRFSIEQTALIIAGDLKPEFDIGAYFFANQRIDIPGEGNALFYPDR
jgi:hypothetical protein